LKGTIIYYGGFSLPDKNAAANRVVSNGKLFDSLGYKTIFLGASYDEAHFDGIKQHPEKENMYEEAHPSTSKEWLKQIFSIENLKNTASKYNEVKLIVLYNVPFVTLGIAKRFFSKKGITVAYDCTEWTRYTEGSFLKKVFKYIDEFFVRNFAHLVADKMIVISKMMEEAYKKNKKLLRLPPLIDIYDEIWHQENKKNKSEFTFCFAGFPGGNKERLDKVVEAFQLLDRDDTKLNIVGITHDEFNSLYPQVKIKEAQKSRIRFLGKRTHKETIKEVLNCDCYIFIRPSDRRNNAGFPTKFAESYTCGVPIITTDVSDIKDYIKNTSESVLLENTSEESIHLAMKSVLENGRRIEVPDLKTMFHYGEYRNNTKTWLQ